MRRSLLSRLRATALHLTGFARRDAMDARAREEMAFHLEMEAQKQQREGLNPGAAQRTARLRFGGRDQWMEASRDEYRSRVLDDLTQDCRYAVRTLGAAPAFTAAAALTLALGIGANTAVFSAVDAALFKPLPYSEPERVVAVFQTDRKKGTTRDAVAPGNFAEWHSRNTSFSDLAVAEPYSLVVVGADGRERVGNWNVTQGFFSVLDVKPALGRLFDATDYQPGRPQILVITYGAWQRRFGGDRSIIGKPLTVSDAPATVVGVLPRDFSYLTNEPRYEMFAPKVLDSIETRLRSSGWYHAVGRIKRGVTLGQANAEMQRVAMDLTREYPGTNTDQSVNVVPIRDAMIGNSAQALLLLLGAVGLVLLIACTNVANLILARTARRRRELAIRVALGAARGRIARQMLTETLVLALVGGVAGVLLAHWGVGVIRQLSPVSVPRIDEMRVDARALVFATVVVMITALMCGLAPALRSPPAAPHDALAGGGRAGGTRRDRRFRAVFVGAEVGLAVMLLIGAGLLIRSFVSVLRLDRGYQSDHVLAASVFVWDYREEDRRQFVARLTERAGALPGVKAAGATTAVPLAGSIGLDRGSFRVEGHPSLPGQAPTANIAALTPSTFDALEIRLQRGRLFAAGDDAAGAPVAIISESMARRYWPGEDALGRHILLGFYGAPVQRTVVGIVADVRQRALETAPDPQVYLPHAQTQSGAVSVVLRTTVPPRRLLPDLRRIVAELDPKLALTYVTTLDEILADSLKPRRFTLVLLGSFAAVALLLAVIGVYGVISNGTAERAREMSVRIALGAQRGDIIRMVLAEGIGAAAAGVTAGLIAAGALAGVLRGMLFSVQPVDPVTYAAVALLMLGTAMLACYLPARRATTADPVSALRAG